MSAREKTLRLNQLGLCVCASACESVCACACACACVVRILAFQLCGAVRALAPTLLANFVGED